MLRQKDEKGALSAEHLRDGSATCCGPTPDLSSLVVYSERGENKEEGEGRFENLRVIEACLVRGRKQCNNRLADWEKAEVSAVCEKREAERGEWAPKSYRTGWGWGKGAAVRSSARCKARGRRVSSHWGGERYLALSESMEEDSIRGESETATNLHPLSRWLGQRFTLGRVRGSQGKNIYMGSP